MGNTSIASMINSSLRTTGISSGLDTDSIVKALMLADQTKIDKAKQNQQLLAWKQEAYRDITSSIQTFYSSYFDILSPTNLTSPSAFNAFKVTYDGADTSAYLSVKASSGVQAGNYSIRNISTVEAAQATGTALSNANVAISGGYILNTDISGISSANNNNKITVTFNGTSKIITIKENPADLADLQSDLQTNLNSAFGSGKITVGTTGTDANGGQLTFATSTTNSLSLSSVTELSVLNTGFSTLGLSGVNTSNKINLTATLASIENNFNTTLVPAAGGGNDIKFTINGQSFEFSSSTATLNSIMTAVNGNATANVTMYYDQLEDRISVKSNNAGATAKVQVADTSGNLMTVLGLNGADVNGTDASIDLSTDGGVTYQTISRSSNSFLVNGLSFNLTANTTNTINMSVSADTSKAVDLIKGFVDKYNSIIDTINKKLSEKRDTNYQPLTDDQKSAMNETDVTKWEDKTKAGLLYNDSILQSMLDNMRSALYSSVSGVSLNMSSIGITTSSSYLDKGKLVIDETKLTNALNNNADQVMKLFTNTSQYSYYETLSDPSKRTVRNSENGIFQKLSDILQDNIRTTRNSSGQKGVLLEKAGIKGDLTEYENLLTKEINIDAGEIDDMLSAFTDKENSLYLKFANMETMLSNLNSQSSWLSQQFSTSSGN